MGDNIPQPQVMSIRDALRLADEMELDLIEISPKANIQAVGGSPSFTSATNTSSELNGTILPASKGSAT